MATTSSSDDGNRTAQHLAPTAAFRLARQYVRLYWYAEQAWMGGTDAEADRVERLARALLDEARQAATADMARRLTGGSATYRFAKGPATVTLDMDVQKANETRIVEAAYGRPTRIEVSYPVDAVITTVHQKDGPDSRHEEAGPLQGRAILWQKASGAWTRTLLGEPPTPAEAKALAEKADPMSVYPEQEVGVGHKWRIEGPALGRYIGAVGRSDVRGHADFSFDGVGDYQGERCARIGESVSAAWKATDDDGRELDLEMNLSGVVYRSLKTLADVSTELHGTMSWKGSTVAEGQTVNFELAGPITFTGWQWVGDGGRH